jgi:hypothetical protein
MRRFECTLNSKTSTPLATSEISFSANTSPNTCHLLPYFKKSSMLRAVLAAFAHKFVHWMVEMDTNFSARQRLHAQCGHIGSLHVTTSFNTSSGIAQLRLVAFLLDPRSNHINRIVVACTVPLTPQMFMPGKPTLPTSLHTSASSKMW